jgi:glyoxylase-like metal-dependent hydrolase (beta-lactamase superfamily II)
MSGLMIGDVRVDRIEEMCVPLFGLDLFANLPEGVVDREMHWLAPNYFDRVAQRIIISSHSWLVRTRHHNILIDTCIGNDKTRAVPQASGLQTPYLERLASIGLSPDDIDFVMCTHLHIDHVGWNTRLIDGRWVPTFRNAKYLCGQAEFDYMSTLMGESDRDEERVYYNDSVLPVVEAGQMQFVGHHFEIDDSISMEHAPGHTPGHMAVRAASGGHAGLFIGDMLHSPIQILYPDVNSVFCADPSQAVATRRRYLDECAEHNHLLLPAHFGSPHIGRVRRAGDSFSFHPGDA